MGHFLATSVFASLFPLLSLALRFSLSQRNLRGHERAGKKDLVGEA